uniref:Transmembrane protein n=1 Tax=Caenorhabditis tropicalis TaxID=1561998 RepID=A0A1I7UCP8_9PELO
MSKATTTTTTTKAFENDYGDFSQFKKGKTTKQTLGEHIYLQYLLVSGIYMLEPWEQRLFNWIITFVLTFVIALIAFLSYNHSKYPVVFVSMSTLIQ